MQSMGRCALSEGECRRCMAAHRRLFSGGDRCKGNGMGRRVQRGQNPKLKMGGDKRTPAGIYAVSPAFGFEPDFGQNLKMPYVALAATHVCVDDPASNDYNQLVDR